MGGGCPGIGPSLPPEGTSGRACATNSLKLRQSYQKRRPQSLLLETSINPPELGDHDVVDDGQAEPSAFAERFVVNIGSKILARFSELIPDPSSVTRSSAPSSPPRSMRRRCFPSSRSRARVERVDDQIAQHLNQTPGASEELDHLRSCSNVSVHDLALKSCSSKSRPS